MNLLKRQVTKNAFTLERLMSILHGRDYNKGVFLKLKDLEKGLQLNTTIAVFAAMRNPSEEEKVLTKELLTHIFDAECLAMLSADLTEQEKSALILDYLRRVDEIIERCREYVKN